MRELTGESFVEILIICSRNSYFKVGIVFDDGKVMKEFITDIREFGEIHGVSRMRYSTGCAILEFYNGSSIEIIPCRPGSVRGRKYHQILFCFVHEMTDDVRGMLSAATISYAINETKVATDAVLLAAKVDKMKDRLRIKDELEQMDDNTPEELDSFLREFKISDMRCAPTCES